MAAQKTFYERSSAGDGNPFAQEDEDNDDDDDDDEGADKASGTRDGNVKAAGKTVDFFCGGFWSRSLAF